MPPKLQVKPKAPPGGRRGGRGGAAAAAASTPAPTEGTTTPAGEPSAVLSAAAATNIPSAATTRSIAPPVGRLDSLRLTPASGSASGTPAPSTPGAGAGGGLRGKAPLRFKPKAVVRKTAEERAKLEATVASPSSTPNPSTNPTGALSSTTRGGFSSRGPRGSSDFRGRGRGGRGRRGGADAGGYQAVASTASGPFALGSVTSGRSKVIHERGVELRRATSKSKKSRGITIDDGGVRVKSERDDPDYYSETDEESDGGPKVNVERIEDLVDSGDSDGEDGGEVVVKREKMPVMFPLRVERYRHEEKERAVPIFKDPETASKKGKGVGGGRKVKVEDGGEEDVEVKVKAEPVDDGDMALVSAPPVDLDASGAPQHSIPTSRPSSPELSKKIPLKPPQSPETRRKSRGKTASAGRRRTQSHVLSPEEEMEIKMEEEDRLATLRELGMSAPRVVGGDGVEDEGASRDLEGIKDGDLFFFQFPTVVPPLERIEPVKIGLGVDEIVVVDVDAPAKLEQKKPGVGKKKVPLDLRAMERQVLPQGVVGQLRVHRSGRVSILWGNPDSPPSSAPQNQPTPQPAPTPTPTPAGTTQPIEMTVTRGAQCEFLRFVEKGDQ